LAEVTRRFLVFGKVQGVFFRHSTRLEAHRLKLCGIARNLPDGSVDVLARGAPSSLDELHAWLQCGPVAARVETVREIAPQEAQPIPEGFEII
jgi:acylphosphatase